jgi:hypothetical protein
VPTRTPARDDRLIRCGRKRERTRAREFVRGAFHSSQSRVAKAESGDTSVSLDLLIKSLGGRGREQGARGSRRRNEAIAVNLLC